MQSYVFLSKYARHETQGHLLQQAATTLW